MSCSGGTTVVLFDRLSVFVFSSSLQILSPARRPVFSQIAKSFLMDDKENTPSSSQAVKSDETSIPALKPSSSPEKRLKKKRKEASPSHPKALASATVATYKELASTEDEESWDSSLNQVRAYKEHQNQKRILQLKLQEEKNADFTPNSKEREERKSVEAYRQWKEGEARRIRLEKKERFLREREVTGDGSYTSKEKSGAVAFQSAFSPIAKFEEEELNTSSLPPAATAVMSDIMKEEEKEDGEGVGMAVEESPRVEVDSPRVEVDSPRVEEVSVPLPGSVGGSDENETNNESDDDDDDDDEDGPLEQSIRDNSRLIEDQIEQSAPKQQPDAPHQDVTDRRSELSRDKDKIEKHIWPTPLSDLNTEYELPPLPTQDSELLQQVRSTKILRVRVVTWNQQAKEVKISPQILTKKLFNGKDNAHIVAIGTEECENTIAKSIVNTSKQKWVAVCKECLGENFSLVRSHTLQATNLLVFIRKALLPLLSSLSSCAISTGFSAKKNASQSMTLGNKGGIGISFNVGSTSFIFLNAHLAAHQNKADKRDEEFLFISEGVCSKLKSDQVNIVKPKIDENYRNSLLSSFDQVFWAGDMNYRINGTRQVVDVLLERNLHEIMVNNDQLTLSRKFCPAYHGFEEGPLFFRPTYKFDKNSDEYDTGKKRRIPSWTDRILYKPDNATLVNYCSADIRLSDHRPVYATLNAKVDGVGNGGGGESKAMGADNIGTTESQVCIIQ